MKRHTSAFCFRDITVSQTNKTINLGSEFSTNSDNQLFVSYIALNFKRQFSG